jgi:pimeloyl-ACP methyl ester carboxylesterase
VHYERRGNPTSANRTILFLHGFGVGSFHFRSQLEGLTVGDEEDDASSCG